MRMLVGGDLRRTERPRTLAIVTPLDLCFRRARRQQIGCLIDDAPPIGINRERYGVGLESHDPTSGSSRIDRSPRHDVFFSAVRDRREPRPVVPATEELTHRWLVAFVEPQWLCHAVAPEPRVHPECVWRPSGGRPYTGYTHMGGRRTSSAILPSEVCAHPALDLDPSCHRRRTDPALTIVLDCAILRRFSRERIEDAGRRGHSHISTSLWNGRGCTRNVSVCRRRMTVPSGRMLPGAHHRRFGFGSIAGARARPARQCSPPRVSPPSIQPAATSDVPGSSR